MHHQHVDEYTVHNPDIITDVTTTTTETSHVAPSPKVVEPLAHQVTPDVAVAGPEHVVGEYHTGAYGYGYAPHHAVAAAAYAEPAVGVGYAAPAVGVGYAAPAVGVGYAAPAVGVGYAAGVVAPEVAPVHATAAIDPVAAAPVHAALYSPELAHGYYGDYHTAHHAYAHAPHAYASHAYYDQ